MTFSDFVVRRVLGIDVNSRYHSIPQDLDKRARETVDPASIYLEDEPSVAEWFKDLAPNRQDVTDYVVGLFPSAAWIRRYNVRWLVGDFVAGITIGLVVVPQALAYASLANLTPPYGLYTSFTGAVLYWIFGTSRDIVIGTTAVGSLLVGNIVAKLSTHSDDLMEKEQIAHLVSILSGAILLLIGLLRLGWIVEFIPYIPISAFVTAASITIMSTQVPTALGIVGINTREAPYKVILNIAKGVPRIGIDAAIGLSSIALLFAIREFCSYMEKCQPAKKRMWSFISSLRMTFTMLLFTLISFIVNHSIVGTTKTSPFRIVGHIEQGFQRAGLPHLDPDLMKSILPEIPAVVVILVIEHIAIAKAMGRVSDYTINPSQEVVALGAANLLSPLVGGYVCTGSFGASAVLSKSGVRTPLAGLFSAGVLILALHALTGVFFFIPNAALAGLIIHAVCNLLTPPKTLYKYWQLSPIEFLIWVIGVVMAVFISLEACIYAGTALSLVLVLMRLARTRGTFLGSVRVKRVSSEKGLETEGTFSTESHRAPNAFLPITKARSTNPDVDVESPYPGVFLYRLHEGYNYTNQAYHADTLASYILEHTQRTSAEAFEKESDRLWNDPGPRAKRPDSHLLPFLRAVILDFGAVNHVDVTSVQGLIDLRNLLDRYAAPDTVEWHFANVQNRWTRRALGVAGFGYPSSQKPDALQNWTPIYTIAAAHSGQDGPFGDENCSAIDVDTDEERTVGYRTPAPSSPTQVKMSAATKNFSVRFPVRACERMAVVNAVNRPFFHVDLHSAVEVAITDARNRAGCCRSEAAALPK